MIINWDIEQDKEKECYVLSGVATITKGPEIRASVALTSLTPTKLKESLNEVTQLVWIGIGEYMSSGTDIRTGVVV